LLAAERSCDFIHFARTPNLNERDKGPVARTAMLRIVAELKAYTMAVWLPLLAYVLHKHAALNIRLRVALQFENAPFNAQESRTHSSGRLKGTSAPKATSGSLFAVHGR
jgi:hypothetical protein